MIPGSLIAVMLLGAVGTEQAPEPSATDARISVGTMVSLLTSLEHEELVLKRGQLLDDMPSFGSSIAMTISGSVLILGSAALWIALGASGSLRWLGGCSSWSCILTVLVIFGVVIATAAGIAGLALIIGGRFKAVAVEAEREEHMKEVRDLDARIERTPNPGGNF